MIIASDIFSYTNRQNGERQNYLVSAELNRLFDPAKGNRNASHDWNSHWKYGAWCRFSD